MNHQSRFDAWYRVLGLVHWDDPEGWDGEGGGTGVQDGEHMYTHGWFMSMSMAKPIQNCKVKKINKTKQKKKKKHNTNLNWLKLFFLPPFQLNYVHCCYFCGPKMVLKKPSRLYSVQHWNKKWSCAHEGTQRQLWGIKLILSKANISCALFSYMLQPTASRDIGKEENSPVD